MVRIGGSTDNTATLFPQSGGLIINPPVGKFLVAKRASGALMTALQGEITRVLMEAVMGQGRGRG